MKKVFYLSLAAMVFATAASAQGLKGLMNKVAKSDSSGTLEKLVGGGGLSTNDIASGLKEALEVGVKRGTTQLSAVDGFFKDAALKILMPPEAQKVEQKLRGLGLGSQVDDAILAMNRAAEDATKSAAPIFVNAIKGMTIQDAAGILKGGDFAATNYLKDKTTMQLADAFRPVIENSLQKVNATKYWNTLFTAYNRVSFDKVNPDLSAYVTEKAMFGIFLQVGKEEQQIRKNPAARTSELLKKVFGE